MKVESKCFVVGYNVNNIDDWNTHRSHLVHAYGADYDARLIAYLHVPAVTRAPQAPNAPVVQSAPLVAETVDARFARLRNYHQIDPISLTEEQKALEEKQRNALYDKCGSRSAC